MAVVSFEIVGSPFDDLTDALKRVLSPTAADLEPVSDAIRGSFANRFAAQGSGDGQSWEELAPATVADRRRNGYPGERPILVRGGDLFDTLTNPENPEHINVLGVYSSEWVLQVGSDDDRTVWLGDGTETIPARPFLEPSPADNEKIADAVDGVFDRLLGL